MENKPRAAPIERVWFCSPQRNHNSLVMTIPAGLRHHLRIHQNSPLLITLHEDGFLVRQVDALREMGAALKTKGFTRRRKSWKRGPQEPKPVGGGYQTEPLPPETEET